MQTLIRSPNFAVNLLNHSWRSSLVRIRAFSSSNLSNQSRGGLPRFYAETLPPFKGDRLRVVGDEFWHMTKVLRLKINDRIELFNGKGGLIEGCIEKVDRTGLDFMALEDPKIVSPHTTEWHVFAAFGTLKGGRADWLVEKCTELGAKSVTPLLTERSPSISENRVDRLQRVILAATIQCQRLHEMTLNPPTKIYDLLPIVSQSKLSLVAVAEANPVISILTSSKTESSGLMIIGPEGVYRGTILTSSGIAILESETVRETVSLPGRRLKFPVLKYLLKLGIPANWLKDFTEEGLNLIIKAGATTVGLGPHRLRVETATMTLLAALMLWSDSQPILTS